MLSRRIIPCLDVREGRVVKGINFVDIVDAGDPVEAAVRYEQEGADEICFLDINASHENRGTMIDVVRRTAEKVFIPITIGGGITGTDKIRELLRNGADKVSINSPALNDPDFINRSSEMFGSQCIVVAVDVKRRAGGSGWDVYKNGGRVCTGRDAIQWIAEAEKRGAGEILLTSMDRDGTKDGYDLEILQKVTSMLDIPVIASGGAGNKRHFLEAAREGGADAMLAASLFHYRELEIKDLKAYLRDNGIPVRLS